jgi:hypothetical protein
MINMLTLVSADVMTPKGDVAFVCEGSLFSPVWFCQHGSHQMRHLSHLLGAPSMDAILDRARSKQDRASSIQKGVMNLVQNLPRDTPCHMRY